MKCVFIALFCFVALSNADMIPLSNILPLYKNIKLINKISKMDKMGGRTVININNHVDNAMESVQMWVIRNGLDPIRVPSMKRGFTVWLGLISLHGEFGMTRGWLQGLSSVRRGGTSLLEIDDNILNFFLPFSIPYVFVTYNYKTKIMNLGPRGVVEGRLQNLQILCYIRLDTETKTFSLDGFRFLGTGKISVKFSGNILTDWLLNALIKISTTLFHDVVTDVVQETVKEDLEASLTQINENIQDRRIYLK